MTTTIPPLSEALRNQTLAALDYWAAHLEREVASATFRNSIPALNGQPVSEDAQRALVWNIAALHETQMARELIGEAEATPPEPFVDHPANATWTQAELAEAYGR